MRVEGEERSGVDGKDREDVALDIGETRKEEEKEDIGILEEDIGDAEKEEEEREREKIIEEVVEEGFRRFRFTLIDTGFYLFHFFRITFKLLFNQIVRFHKN